MVEVEGFAVPYISKTIKVQAIKIVKTLLYIIQWLPLKVLSFIATCAEHPCVHINYTEKTVSMVGGKVSSWEYVNR